MRNRIASLQLRLGRDCECEGSELTEVELHMYLDMQAAYACIRKSSPFSTVQCALWAPAAPFCHVDVGAVSHFVTTCRNPQSTYFPRDETGLVCLPTQLERTLQLY